MKRDFRYIIIIGLIIALCASPVFAAEEIAVVINGESAAAKQTMVNNELMLEYNVFLKALGVKYTYDFKTRTLTIAGESDKLLLTLGSKAAVLNGKKVTLQEAPALVGPELFIPAKFTCESLKMEYKHDAQNKRVDIITPGKLLTLKEIVKLSNAVVLINTFDEKHEPLATGSGFIISANGTIVTNYHVIDKARYCEVVTTDNKVYAVSRVRDYNAEDDIAIMQIDLVSNLPYVELGDSSAVEQGDDVVAIGSPLSLQNTVSTGIVSAVRTIGSYEIIQTTTPISPGSSGGALFSMFGKVIGVTTAKAVDGENIGFVVPSDTVKDYISDNKSYDEDYSFEEIYKNEHIEYYSNGDWYEGDFKDGMLHGFGTYYWANGDTYMGEFVDGDFEGIGIFTGKNGFIYRGQWKDDKMNGYGEALYTDKWIYKGYWVNDMREGYGELYDDKGRLRYAGQFYQDKVKN